MSALEQGYITPEQYLELERKAAFKSEYFSGRMFAMSVGSNVHALLWSQLRAGHASPSTVTVFSPPQATRL